MKTPYLFREDGAPFSRHEISLKIPTTSLTRATCACFSSKLLAWAGECFILEMSEKCFIIVLRFLGVSSSFFAEIFLRVAFLKVDLKTRLDDVEIALI